MTNESIRILAISATWQGANDHAFVRSFRRAGHSVTVISPDLADPPWHSKRLKVARRGLRGLLRQEFNRAVLDAADAIEPNLFFAFKGQHLDSQTVRTLKNRGIIAIQFYPDTGFGSDPRLLKSLTEFDWIFSTKPHHVGFFSERFGFVSTTFVPHAFDPETHRPWPLNAEDIRRYGCDVSFIGSWSAKKGRTLHTLLDEFPSLDLRIWGPSAGWSRASLAVRQRYQGYALRGLEYAKAIRAAKISLGLLFEGSPDAPARDVITARTFEIPACGGFMLHERTPEAETYLQDKEECVFFDDDADLALKVRDYLARDAPRKTMAAAATRRCETSSYSVDDRASLVLKKFRELSDARGWKVSVL